MPSKNLRGFRAVCELIDGQRGVSYREVSLADDENDGIRLHATSEVSGDLIRFSLDGLASGLPATPDRTLFTTSRTVLPSIKITILCRARPRLS
jgi:hypothetical protein